MTEPRQSSIRADVRALQDDGTLGPKVGEVVVTPGDLVFAIHTEAGTVFRAPLGMLAWQLALMEPGLARWLVEPEDGHYSDEWTPISDEGRPEEGG